MIRLRTLVQSLLSTCLLVALPAIGRGQTVTWDSKGPTAGAVGGRS